MGVGFPLSAGAEPVQVSTPTLAPSGLLSVLHPLEGAKLPVLNQVFVYGSVVPGSTVTLNGIPAPVYATGGYLAMVPLTPGEFLLTAEAVTPTGETLKVERRFTVSSGFTPMPLSPLAIDKASVTPADDLWLAAGDLVKVAFQGTPGAAAEFSVEGLEKHIPMVEVGASSASRRGFYQGHVIIRPKGEAERAEIVVSLKRGRELVKAKAPGRLTIDRSAVLRIGQITEDTVAVRTGPEGGYDLFLSKGMRVTLTGKIGSQWRIRVASNQTGWVRESAIQELPKGTAPPASLLTNITVTHTGESSTVRISLNEMLPYRVEQRLDPPQLVITVYGAVDKTDLIRFDPQDPVIGRVGWKQIAPDAAQVIIEPKFSTWWGYDTRYEGTQLIAEIRQPWEAKDLRGLVIAVDAGHGGSDSGAMGPLGTLEKEANLGIARAVQEALEKAGAKPFLIRDQDIEVPLYERARIAWKGGARLFISVHSNSAGLWENPVWTNGSSVYFYQPQSQALAEAIHAGYRKHVGMLPDRGLFYADFAVCRMTQMPAVLTENAYIIVPEQEQMLFDPKFQKNFANAIVNGIKAFVAGK